MQLQEQQMAVLSSMGAVTGWVSQANEWMQFFAYGIAVLSGLVGLYTFIERKRKERRNANKRRKLP